jgi:hypothetical protein
MGVRNAGPPLLSGISHQESHRKTAFVCLKIQVRLPDGSRPYLDPVPSKKEKLKPLCALVNGEHRHHSEGVDFLRYAHQGSAYGSTLAKDWRLALGAKLKQGAGYGSPGSRGGDRLRDGEAPPVRCHC